MALIARLLILLLFMVGLWKAGGKIVQISENRPYNQIPIPSTIELDRATRDNDTEMLNIYINKKKISPDTVINEQPLIFIAIHSENKNAITLLAKSGANLNLADSKGKKPITFAKEKRRDDLVQLLLSLGAQEDGVTIDWSVAYRGKSQDELLKLFQTAVNSYKDQTAMDIYEAGLRIDYKDQYGNTPLTFAVLANREPVVAFLFENGASPNQTTDSGRPLFFYAVTAEAGPSHQPRPGSSTMLDTFIKYNVRIDLRDTQGNTAIQDLEKMNRLPQKDAVIEKLKQLGG